MNRLFGSKAAKPKPSLNEAIASTEARADGVQGKIKKLDVELGRYRDQMKKMSSGPGKVRSFKQNAVESLNRADGVFICRMPYNNERSGCLSKRDFTKRSSRSFSSNHTTWSRLP